MPEGTSPPPLDPHKATKTDPAVGFLWFDGILEGPVGDRDMLRHSTNRLDAIGIVGTNLEIEGGKFSILLDDRSRKMSATSQRDRQRFVDLVEEVVSLSSDPMRVESTLRCTEIQGATAQETLFAVAGGKIQKISRTRKATNEDYVRKPRPTSVMGQEFESPKSRKIFVATLVAFCAVAVAWQFGVIDKAMAPAANEIVIKQDTFGSLLAVDIKKNWGIYSVTLSRGQDFPQSMSQFMAKVAAAPTMKEAAMFGAVARGETIYVRLVDENEDVLFEKGLSMKPLLLDRDGEVTVLVPGMRVAQSLHLALAPMPRQK